MIRVLNFGVFSFYSRVICNFINKRLRHIKPYLCHWFISWKFKWYFPVKNRIWLQSHNSASYLSIFIYSYFLCKNPIFFNFLLFFEIDNSYFPIFDYSYYLAPWYGYPVWVHFQCGLEVFLTLFQFLRCRKLALNRYLYLRCRQVYRKLKGHWHFCRPTHMSVGVFMFPCIHQYVCISISMCVCLWICLYICRSILQPWDICGDIHMFVRTSVCLGMFVHLSVCLLHLSICLYVCEISLSVGP